MAEEARRVGAVVVHYSTDYVFDGRAATPYDERARPNPINLYGQTKLAGERSVAAADVANVVIRTSWVYSIDGSGFVPTLVRQLGAGEPVRVVADQVGSPTWSRSLARATAAILRGDLPTAIDCLESMPGILSTVPQPEPGLVMEMRLAQLTMLGTAAALAGDHDRGTASLHEVIAISEHLGEYRYRFYALWTQALSSWQPTKSPLNVKAAKIFNH
jgi:hypothetical protein